MAAGKSTLAKELSRDANALLLSEDDLLANLYPDQITDLPSYIHLSSRLKNSIESIVVDSLKLGLSLVLDFPANTVQQRKWLVNLSKQAGARHELHYIELSDTQCKDQLLKRAVEHPERAATDTVQMFEAVTKYFEPPSLEEGLNLRKTNQRREMNADK